MPNQIVISGMEQDALLRLLNKVAHEGLDLEGSITKMEVFSTTAADTYVVRPNGNEIDFWLLCEELRERCHRKPSVQLRAWMKVRYGMFDLPKGDYCVAFDDAHGLLFCNKQGCQFRIGAGEEDTAAEEVGHAVYQPSQKLPLTSLPARQGVIAVGDPRRAKLLKDSLSLSGAGVLVWIFLALAAIILFICCWWMYRETVLPDSIHGLNFEPWWLFFVLLILVGYMPQSKIVKIVFIVIFSLLMLFSLPFLANSTIHTEHVEGRGVIVSSFGGETSHNYKVDIIEPEGGTATVRMYHNGSFSEGDTCIVVMDRGVLGLLHVDSLSHPSHEALGQGRF